MASERVFGILGANAAGLAFARAAEAAGHTAIVLDFRGDASRQLKDGGFGRGLAPEYHLPAGYVSVARLARHLGLVTTPADLFEYVGHQGTRTKARLRRAAFSYLPMRHFEFPRIAEPGLAHSAAGLATGCASWLEDNELLDLAVTLGPAYTGAGWGYLDDEVPALYLAKFLADTAMLPEQTDATTAYRAGYRIEGGVQRLLSELADELVDVRDGMRVERIARTSDGVSLCTDMGSVHVDDLVITEPIDKVVHLFAGSPDEVEIARQVRYQSMRYTVCTIRDLPLTSGSLLVVPNAIDPSRRGRCVQVQPLEGQDGMYACWSYLSSAVSAEESQQLLADDIRDLGGRITAVHSHGVHDGMPYFGTADIAGGVLERIEGTQGANHTYYTGPLLAGWSLEGMLTHATDLVERYFTDSHRTSPGTFAAPGTAKSVDRSGFTSVPPAELRTWLVERIAALTWVDPESIDPDAPLDTFGLHSLSVSALLAEMRRRFGVTAETLFARTVNEFVAQLSGTAAHDGTLLIAFEGDPERTDETNDRVPPVFWIPGAGSQPGYLEPLAQAAEFGGRSYAFLPQDMAARSEDARVVHDIADRYLTELLRIQPQGPYRLVGHSFGGTIAYELGARLAELGADVRVVMMDSPLYEPGNAPPAKDLEDTFAGIRAVMGLEEDSSAIDWSLCDTDLHNLIAKAIDSDSRLGAEILEFWLRNGHEARQALQAHSPSPSSFPVLLLRAADTLPGMSPAWHARFRQSDPTGGWNRELASGLRIAMSPGDHYRMVKEPNLREAANACHAFLTSPTIDGGEHVN